MFRIVSSALAALVLAACAHGGTVARPPAGRAAQPFGWPRTLADSAQPEGPVTLTAAPGGRAAQPFGWPDSLRPATTAPLSKSPATAYVGGRAAQPFGWPEQPIAQKKQATTIAVHKGAAVH